MRPGAQFSNNIIPAILHLTAQSVEGLKPENIAVVDVAGNILSKPIENQDEMSTDSRLTYQKNMENGFVRKIINLLEPIVGPGKVRANVKLTLDFDKVETTEETFDPERVAKISEKSGISSSNGLRTGNNADASIQANPNARSKSENSEVNYGVSKKVTHVIKPAGEIKRISAAVVLDDNARVEMVDGRLQKDILKRSPEELETYTRLIQLAIGYNAERGDVIEVANLSFDTSALTENDFLQEQEQNKQLIYDLFKYGFYIILLLLLFLLIRPVFRKAAEIVRSAAHPGYDGINMHGLDRAKISAIQDAMDKAEIERELLEQYKIPKSSKKSSIIRDKVIDFAGKNIDETASLVRSLLVED
jgi:flagellar M-ring protein FliF